MSRHSGSALKKAGMTKAALNRKKKLEVARRVAVALAKRNSQKRCTADDVRFLFESRGIPFDLGPAAGSLFKGDQWEFTGDWTESKHPQNHSRMLRVWKLKI